MFGIFNVFGPNSHDGTLQSNVNGGQFASNAQLGDTWFNGLSNGYNLQLSQIGTQHGYYNPQGIAAQQYNTLLNASANQIITKPKQWVFDGEDCTVREMADKIWPQSCPEKTHFLLKYE